MWDILDSANQPVHEADATYNSSTGKIKITGNITFDSVYYLEGNDTTKELYLSNKANNGKDGNWAHVENITKNVQDKVSRTFEIDITNNDFFSFLSMEEHAGLSWLKCDNNRCGCDNKFCKKRKKAWNIKGFEFNKTNRVLYIKVDEDFGYDKVYHFSVDLDENFFKSTLTLKFDITTVYDTLTINTTANPRNSLIQVPPLCTKIWNNDKNSTNFLVNETTLANVKDVYDFEIKKADNNQIKFKCGPKFNYSWTYELKCSEKLSHSKMAFKFDIKKEMASASLGVGVASIVALIIVGGVIVIAKKKQVSKKKEEEKEASLFTTLIDEDPLVDVCDRKFPKSTVKAWKDITLEKELGSGQFGKVYKGFLHLGKYTR